MKILIIDDEEEFRESLGLFLEKKGHHIFMAETALEGLKIAKEEKIDVLFVDLMLPGMEGVIVLDLLKKDLPFLDIIVVTGLSEDDRRVQAAKKLKINEILFKPIDFAKLGTILDNIEKKIKKKPENYSISITGLSLSGKTSLVNRFLFDRFISTHVTIGMNYEYYNIDNSIIRLIDLGGQTAFKDLFWPRSVQNSDAVIFVFDVSTQDIEEKTWQKNGSGIQLTNGLRMMLLYCL